ncbi:hypothetical protein ACJJTC_002678 [Scirpophaga incertulas]
MMLISSSSLQVTIGNPPRFNKERMQYGTKPQPKGLVVMFPGVKERRRVCQAKGKCKREKRTAILSCLSRMKSMMQVSHSSITPAYELYSTFCRETTLHGLKHTVDPSVHVCERLLWFLVGIGAFFGAIYCALSQWYRYNSEPVVMSMQRDYRQWWTAFPAVTACFMERIDPEKARQYIQSQWNVTEESNQDSYSYYYGFLDLITDVSFRTNLQNFWKYQNDDTVKDIDLMLLAFELHPDTNLKFYWLPVMTEVGMCITYNSAYSQFQNALKEMSLKDWQLHRCHYLSGQCFLRIDSADTVRYFIHSPFEISTALSNPTGEIMPGEELILDFKVCIGLLKIIIHIMNDFI